jgi:carnitine O-palmitoyltransferase 2
MPSLPTQFFTHSLPNLPLPTIAESLRRYLFFLSPLVSPKLHLEATTAAANFAISNTAYLAQANIVKHAHAVRSHESYMTTLWLDSYLKTRTPLPIHTTPQLTFLDDLHILKMKQTTRAADLTYAAVKFSLDLAAETIPPPIYHTRNISKSHYIQTAAFKFLPIFSRSPAFYLLGAYPLDVSQYSHLFGSTRIPHRLKDELKSFWNLWQNKKNDSTSPPPPPPQHILVLRRGHSYKVSVFELDGTVSLPEVLQARFEAVISDADADLDISIKNHSVASLTSTSRDIWADARIELMKDPINKSSIEISDSALFALTLDEDAPSSLAAVSRAMLIGNGQNRWFDKSFNLVVFSNGKAGLSWEHSWGDGIAILTLFEALHKSACAQAHRSHSSSTTTSSHLYRAHRLPWNLSSSSKESIQEACKAANEMSALLFLRVFRSDLLSRTTSKNAGFSPDALLQMSLQLGYAKAHPLQLTSPSTYEAASTSAFFKGRTETIRVASPESATFIKTFRSSSSSISDRLEALKAASFRHRTSSIESASGKGCDRHLFALQNALPTDPLFNNDAWTIWSKIRLSTSTLSSPALEGGGFGPVNDTAYSIGYGSSDDGCQFSLACWKNQDKQQIDGESFKSGIEEALEQISLVARK